MGDLPPGICCYTFRTTDITAYLGNRGTIKHTQAIAAHESPRTTKLYDRTGDAITLDEIERILIRPARGKWLQDHKMNQKHHLMRKKK